jgi:hypothetical protein
VLAWCEEDIRWLKHKARLFNHVHIMSKCGRTLTDKERPPNVSIEQIPNIGSCDYAYLTYIIDNYDQLPETIYFTKGSKPFFPLESNGHCTGPPIRKKHQLLNRCGVNVSELRAP